MMMMTMMMQEVDAGGGCSGWVQGLPDVGGGYRRRMQGVDAGGVDAGGVQVDPPRLVASLGDRRREIRPQMILLQNVWKCFNYFGAE